MKVEDFFRAGLVGLAICHAIMMACFLAVGRHELFLSPEEGFALSKVRGEYKSV